MSSRMMWEVVLNSVALERSQSFWRLETLTTRRSCSMLRVGRVTWIVAGGCAVCHGGVWFLQGRKVRSSQIRSPHSFAVHRPAQQCAAPPRKTMRGSVRSPAHNSPLSHRFSGGLLLTICSPRYAAHRDAVQRVATHDTEGSVI